MGVADIKSVWNAISPDYPVQSVLVHYDRDDGGQQWQTITFNGMTPAGEKFQVTTDPHDMASDTLETAREAATKFLAALAKDPSA